LRGAVRVAPHSPHWATGDRAVGANRTAGSHASPALVRTWYQRSLLRPSSVITLATVVLLIVLGSLCAYAIARHRTRLNSTLYYLFVVGIILPHQAAILPLFSAQKELGLTGTHIGVILVYTGFMMPLTVFLYAGFMRGVPGSTRKRPRSTGRARCACTGASSSRWCGP
jgi:ABC-type glycerol-3-phosphate transport system permease component